MDFICEPGLKLYLPLYELDGASFVSRDACGHLCTVTGALWRANGRYFDGVDDEIVVSAHDAIGPTTNDFTVEVWFNSETESGDYLLYFRKDGTHRFYVRLDANGVIQVYFLEGEPGVTFNSPEGAYSADTWHHVVLSFDRSANLTVYVDTDEIATQDISSESGDMGNTPVSVGGEGNFTGLIGEFRFYNNRLVSLLEIQHNYLATKWRYR